MPWSEHHLAHGERALGEQLGIAIAALRAMEFRQVAKRCCHIGMVRPECFLQEGDCPLVERLGVSVSRLGVIELS